MTDDEKTITQDDLRYCEVCHAPLECVLSVFGKRRIIPCACTCQYEQWLASETERIKSVKQRQLQRMKAHALQDPALLAYTFEKDNGQNPAMHYVKQYAKHWPTMYEQGTGLLLWGGVGTGKTFAAACIAHAIVSQGVSVLMTNFSKIMNHLSGLQSEEKNRYLASLQAFDLLIIDDLGTQRHSDYVIEQIYHIIDSRYLSHRPFIITTNLSLDMIKNPSDIAHARIYDRILERCVPICFVAVNYRKENRAAQKPTTLCFLTNNEEEHHASEIQSEPWHV